MSVLRVVGQQSTGQGLALVAAVAVERVERYRRKDDTSREQITRSATLARMRPPLRELDNGGKDRYATRSLLLDIR